MTRLFHTLLVVVCTLMFSIVTAFGDEACACTTAGATFPVTAQADAPAPPEAKSAVPEADRAAILAMAGRFRVTFDFKETLAIQPGYTLHEPHTSQATEWVQVIEDRGDFISLQHILVMHPKEGEALEPDADGKASSSGVSGVSGGPTVVKHWRQDWRYEDTDVLAFKGRRTWEHETLDADAVKGTWTQAVFEVNDAPRYESVGRWTHVGSESSWQSELTWRPLPRREYTQRHDYQVLLAHNRHVITPTGWAHEQANRKLVLAEDGSPQDILVHEAGLNRYDRVTDVDFSAGETYWDRTAPFWSQVRAHWAETFARNERFSLRAKVDDQRLHAKLFALAEQATPQDSAEASRDAAKRVIDAFVVADAE